MHTDDVKKLAEIGVNIEISKESKIHPEDAIEIVKIASSRGNHVTIRKSYHPDYLVEIAQIGRERVTIEA